MWLSLMKPITLRPVSSLDLAADVGLHDALPAPAQIEHGHALAGVGERLLAAREGVLEHDEDAVVAERGLRLRRAAAGRARERPDDRVGDRRRELPVGPVRPSSLIAAPPGARAGELSLARTCREARLGDRRAPAISSGRAADAARDARIGQRPSWPTATLASRRVAGIRGNYCAATRSSSVAADRGGTVQLAARATAAAMAASRSGYTRPE